MNKIKVKISDLGKIVTGKTPSSKSPEDFGNEILFATPPDFVNQKYIQSTERKLSQFGARKLNSRLLPPNSVMITCIGDIGRISLNKSEAITNQQINSIIVDEEKFDPHYLYYALNHHKPVFVKNAGKTVVPILNKAGFEEIEITIIQEKNDQKKIADVLSALDAKIELNARVNAELESLAKTIYDYWFVQFAPHKSAGGGLVWNEELKREIPLGWEVVELSDIANITMGQSPPGESYNEDGEGMIFFQGATDFGNRFPSVRQFTMQPTRFAKTGDILLSVRAPVGTINIAKEDCCIGRGLAALNSKDGVTTYLFEVMKNLKQVFDRRNVNGTTFGSITKDDLFSLRVLKPGKSILEKYHKIISPTFEQQNKLDFESQALTELRDWLLPLLMNGQVKV
ncbi:MAG: restriction endonuclease subunit S [Anaerolineales bacterium]|nr:restriction endonuclease subunit S [Anaerolineales bacterium]